MIENSVTVGEVHTGLLRNSMAVSAGSVEQLLAVVLGEHVRRSDRPIPHVTSPSVLTGVDCQLPTTSGAKVRAVGTVVSYAAVTGGHILQGSAFTTIRRGGVDRRLPWSHYLAQAGYLETLNRADPNDFETGLLSDPGFVLGRVRADLLDLGSIGRRALEEIQSRTGLDQRPAISAMRTRLRWAFRPRSTSSDQTGPQAGSKDDDTVTFALHGDEPRTLQLRGTVADAAATAEFCADVARHDWLLTTLLSMVERSRLGGRSRTDALTLLVPALDHLVHLWMPATRTHAALMPAWQALEEYPGFTRQWQATVNRIRDQVAAGHLEHISAGRERSVAAHGS
jgi:hypothetical protein